jgi:hypothetical protein
MNLNEPALKEYFRLSAPMQEYIRMQYEYNAILNDLDMYIKAGVIRSDSLTASKMAHSATHVLRKYAGDETKDCSFCDHLAKFE